ncbi:MAG TPA: P1 family peptidase [Gemmatimonadales bacterium]|nr:P1 family peptidase [Gemmatimonadales bacterium]
MHASHGILVGHATDHEGGTGCTVILGERGPFRAACHVLGRATGTRELYALRPDHLVDRTDAIFLTGGSAYGLDATGGLMVWLEKRGQGFDVGGGVVPIVPAAVIFDLAFGSFAARPTAEMAVSAAESARATGIEEGSVGAGTGATVGKALGAGGMMKGGFGISEAEGSGIRVLAMAVVNAFGDVLSADGRIIAGARNPEGGFADTSRLLASAGDGGGGGSLADATGRNTTLCVVAVDRPVPRVELQELARASAGALYRRLRPAGSLLDGDVVFAVSPLPEASEPERVPNIGERLALAALGGDALEGALERAVTLARGRNRVPGIADS